MRRRGSSAVATIDPEQSLGGWPSDLACDRCGGRVDSHGMPIGGVLPTAAWTDGAWRFGSAACSCAFGGSAQRVLGLRRFDDCAWLPKSLSHVQLAALYRGLKPGGTLVEAAMAIPETREQVEAALHRIGARLRIPAAISDRRLEESKAAILRACLAVSAPEASGFDPELGF